MSGPLRPGRPVKVIVQAYQEVEARKRQILRHADEVHRRLSDTCRMLSEVLDDAQFIQILRQENLATIPMRLALRVRGPVSDG